MTAETTVRGIIESAVAAGREALTPDEAKRVCDAYDIPSADQAVAASATEAVAIAEQIGYPVAAKIVSPDIAHKTDAGGVVLDIGDAGELASAYDRIIANARAFDADAAIDGVLIQRQLERTQDTQEVIVGGVTDPVFGKLVGFGPRRPVRGSVARHHVPVGAGHDRRDVLDARRHCGGRDPERRTRRGRRRSHRAGNPDRQCEPIGLRFPRDRGTGPESRVRKSRRGVCRGPPHAARFPRRTALSAGSRRHPRRHAAHHAAGCRGGHRRVRRRGQDRQLGDA